MKHLILAVLTFIVSQSASAADSEPVVLLQKFKLGQYSCVYTIPKQDGQSIEISKTIHVYAEDPKSALSHCLTQMEVSVLGDPGSKTLWLRNSNNSTPLRISELRVVQTDQF